jgi:competence protein ComEA
MMFKKLLVLVLTGLLSFGVYAANTANTAVEKVDINTADAATLDRVLTGIGPKKAAAIVQYRTEHGAFKKIEELEKVNGIGEKLINANRDRIIISEPATR